MPASFIAPRKSLLKAVKAASKPIPSRGHRPILQCVRISVNGLVEVTGTSLEQCSTMSTGAWERDGEAVAVVNAKRLTAALSASKAKDVFVSLGDAGLSIDGATLPTDIVDDFPALPGLPDGSAVLTVTMPAKLLRAALQAALVAVDTESTRYALGGVLVDTQDGVSLVSTDTRRLLIYRCDGANVDCAKPDELFRHVLPTSAVTAIIAALDCVDGDAVISFGDTKNDCSVVADGVHVWTKLVEGRFPRYRAIVPDAGQMPVHVRIGADELTECSRVAGAACSEESRGVDYTWDGNSGTLTAVGQSADNGKASSVVPCVVVSDTRKPTEDDDGNIVQVKPLTICIDPRFVRDMVELVKKQTVDVLMEDDNSPALLTCGAITYLVMPLSRDR